MRTARLALAGFLLASQSVSAQDRIIRFGLTGDYPPFAERRPDGGLVGADIIIARQVAKELGARAEFVMTDWQSLAGDLANDRFDVAIGGLTVTPDRAAIGTFSIPLIQDGKRPLALCKLARRFRTLTAIDRAGVRVQINRGPAIGTLSQNWFSRALVTVNNDDADLVPALLEGRSDVWITDGFVVDHMARRYKGKLCATTRKPFTRQTKAWLIRADPSLVRQINARLKAFLRSGIWLNALNAVP